MILFIRRQHETYVAQRRQYRTAWKSAIATIRDGRHLWEVVCFRCSTGMWWRRALDLAAPSENIQYRYNVREPILERQPCTRTGKREFFHARMSLFSDATRSAARDGRSFDQLLALTVWGARYAKPKWECRITTRKRQPGRETATMALGEALQNRKLATNYVFTFGGRAAMAIYHIEIRRHCSKVHLPSRLSASPDDP